MEGTKQKPTTNGAPPTLRYYFGTVPWNRNELIRLDRQVRKATRRQKAHQYSAYARGQCIETKIETKLKPVKCVVHTRES